MDRSVTRGLMVLDRICRASTPLRLSDLAHDLGLQRSTVHRILRTLVELGHVEQEPVTDRYRPTLKVWELGMAVIDEHPVRRAAAPFLKDLHQATGETVALTVLAGDDVLYLDKITAPRPMAYSTRVGSRVPAPLAAGGVAILALEPGAAAIVDRVAQRLLNRRDFDAAAFMAQLEQVRERGYSLTQPTAGVMGFGGAILGRDGHAAGALSVTAPTARLTDAKQALIVEAMLHACASMAEAVGEI